MWGDPPLPHHWKEIEHANAFQSFLVVAVMIAICLERRSTAGQPGAELQQVSPGSALDRASWHPDDYHAPLKPVYTRPLYSPLHSALRKLN